MWRLERASTAPEAPPLPARPGEREDTGTARGCSVTPAHGQERSCPAGGHTRMLLVPRPSEAVPRHTHAITLEGLVGEGSPSAASSLITS